MRRKNRQDLRAAPRRRRSAGQPTQTRFSATYHRGEQPKTDRGGEVAHKPRLLLIALLAVVGAIFFVWISRIDAISIRGIEDDQTAQELEDSAEAQFRFFWDVHRDSLDGFAHIHRYEVASLDWRRRWFSRELHLIAAPRQPVLQWLSGDELYLVDDLGIAVSHEGADEPELPRVVDRASLPVDENEQIAPSAFVAFVDELVRTSNLSIESISIVDTTSELVVELEEGYDAKLSTTQDMMTQVDNIARLQAVAQDRNESIDEYVDVRILHKGYYR